jgi:hypothetical protein
MMGRPFSYRLACRPGETRLTSPNFCTFTGWTCQNDCMTKEQIKAVLDRVLTWPTEAQEEALASLETIEEQLAGTSGVSEGDREALARSSDDVAHGRFASDTEVREVFDRFRRR